MFENELNKVYEAIDEKDCTIASLKPFLQKNSRISWKYFVEKIIEKDQCSS